MSRSAQRRRQMGFSVVELLVGLTISMFLLGSVIFTAVSSSQNYSVLNDLSRLQENGRVAMEFLARELRMAGYFGCYEGKVANGLSVASGDLYDASADVEGLDNTGTTWQPSGNTALVSDITDGTDAITVRYANPSQMAVVETAMGTTDDSLNAAQSADDYQFQQGNIVIAASCDLVDVFRVTADPTSGNVLQHSDASQSSGPSNVSAVLSGVYKAGAEVRGYRGVRYFVKSGGNNVGSLFRRSVDVNGITDEEELVEGVENMQLLYGEDTDGDNDADSYNTAAAVGSWDRVVSVRVALLLRTVDEYGTNSDEDTKTYQLLNVTVDPDDLRVRRQVYTATIMLRNRV
jgi:type IV pilus assembly protein PilW